MKRVLLLSLVLLLLSGCAATRETRTRSYESLLQGRLANSEAVVKAAAAGMPSAAGMSDARQIKNIVIPSLNAAERQRLDTAYELDMARMLARCDNTFQRYESRADRGRQASFWISMIGAVAGAVIVPALAAKEHAAKSAIAAWGGISGVANTAQTVMKDVGIDAASHIATRDAIIKKFHEAIKHYLDATTPDAKENAIVEGYAACLAYAVASAKIPVTEAD